MAVVPSWVEAHCVVPDGFRQGAPFRLYDYQLLYFANFYLVRGDVEFDPVNPILGPAFVYRRGLLVGPQKLGKGPHTAAHVCVEGVGPALFAGWAGDDDGYACADHGCGCGWEYAYDPGEPMGMGWPTPLIQITAFSEEQTDNIYDALRPMIEQGPLSDVIPKTGEEFIRLPGGGRIDTVTSSAQSRLGQRVTFVPQDEVGIWTKVNKMTKVADTQYRGLSGMGGRASLTSNAWDPSEKSVAQEQYDSTDAGIYRQMAQPPANLRNIKAYLNKRTRTKIHRIVYPPDVLRENGGHVDPVAIESEAGPLAAKDAPQAMRFYGNIIVAGGGRAVDPKVWAARKADVGEVARVGGSELLVPPKGSYIGVAFDGSEVSDHTAIIGTTRGMHQFLLGHWDPKTQRGGKVPGLEVEERVAWIFDWFTVGLFLYDPAYWRIEGERWAGMYGDEVVLEFPQSDRRMAPATDRWMTAVAKGQMTHDGSQVFTDHVVAAHHKPSTVRSDTDGSRLPILTKGDDGEKIDCAVCAVMSMEAAATMPDEPAPSPAPFFLR